MRTSQVGSRVIGVRILAAVTFAILAVARSAPAQTTPPSPPSPQLLFELRLGALRPQAALIPGDPDFENSTTAAALGARFTWYLGRPLNGRLSVQFGVDWAPVGEVESVDPDLGSRVKREGHWFAFSPAVGVDLATTRRFAAEAHAGVSGILESTTFLLERSNPTCSYSTYTGYSCEGDFDNVCDLAAFSARCSDHGRAAFALGAGARWYATRRLHFGVDYTWMSYGRHVVVGTIGFR
jgi:opacity protein-like surface antigen